MHTRSRWAALGFIAVALAFVFGSLALAADPLPAAPTRYFNDYAKLVPPQTAERLNSQLEQYEKDSSNQILVVIYPRLHTDLAFEDFTQRTAESWRVGQKKLNNGAILFIFQEDRKARIEVGYGLEGAIPDLKAKQILDNEIRPAFREGRYEQGVSDAVTALIQASKGEYTGTGKTVANSVRHGPPRWMFDFLGPLVLFAVIWLISRAQSKGGTMYGPRGRRSYRQPSIFWGGGGGGWGSGGGSWGSGGGGGGFSGGGGSFGGGGASGDW